MITKYIRHISFKIFSKIPESKIKDKIRGWVFSSLRKVVFGDIIKNFKELKIKKSGIEDGLPFVKLENGLNFYGYLPSKNEKIFYDKLPVCAKQKINKKCIQVAKDIVKRYVTDHHQKYYKVKSGDTVIELGAYLGFYTIKLAEMVGKSGKVIAVEASKDNFNILKKNIEKNNLDNVILINKVIWDSITKKRLYINYRKDKKQGNDLFKLNVNEQNGWKLIETITIDEILKKYKINKVELMIIEVNGAEVNALKGTKCSLDKIKNVQVAAPYKTNGTPNYKKIYNLLKEKFYVKTEYMKGANSFGIIYAKIKQPSS